MSSSCSIANGPGRTPSSDGYGGNQSLPSTWGTSEHGPTIRPVVTTQVSTPHSRRRPWFAALLSVFLPGLGQVYGGAERRGVALFAIDAALLAFLYYVYQAMRPFLAVLGGNRDAEISGFAQELVNGWFRPGGLALYMVINVAILVFRGWAAYDAAEVTRGPVLVQIGRAHV